MASLLVRHLDLMNPHLLTNPFLLDPDQIELSHNKSGLLRCAGTSFYVGKLEFCHVAENAVHFLSTAVDGAWGFLLKAEKVAAFVERCRTIPGLRMEDRPFQHIVTVYQQNGSVCSGHKLLTDEEAQKRPHDHMAIIHSSPLKVEELRRSPSTEPKFLLTKKGVIAIGSSEIAHRLEQGPLSDGLKEKLSPLITLLKYFAGGIPPEGNMSVLSALADINKTLANDERKEFLRFFIEKLNFSLSPIEAATQVIIHNKTKTLSPEAQTVLNLWKETLSKGGYEEIIMPSFVQESASDIVRSTTLAEIETFFESHLATIDEELNQAIFCEFARCFSIQFLRSWKAQEVLSSPLRTGR